MPSTQTFVCGKNATVDEKPRRFSYTSIPSFVEYLLVSQDEVLVEQRVRLRPQEWRQLFFHQLEDSVTLAGRIVLPLSAIYAGVKLLG